MLWELISATFLGVQWIKEKAEPRIPAENWRNKKLYEKDRLDPNVSTEQLMKNVSNGKYWMSDAAYEAYKKAEEPKYTLHKPMVRLEGDYILISSITLSQHSQDFSVDRACKSLEKHGKVELDKSTPSYSIATDEKVKVVYDSILQRIKDHYDGKISIRKKSSYGHIVIELDER